MADLSEVYAQTVTLRRLLERLAAGETGLLRQQILPLLRTRGRLVAQLEKPCPAAQRALAEQVVAENRQIDLLLEAAKRKLVAEMSSFRLRKQSLSHYRNPYERARKHSVFIDERE
ncbi:MAG: hypothetical protein ABF868_11355 [Sporolactobacillus sp.]